MAVKAKKSTVSAPLQSSTSSSDAPRFANFSYAEFATMGCENIEAAVQTNSAVSAGIEAVGQEFTAYARSTLQSTSDLMRGLLGARTLEDVVKLHADLTIRNLEGIVSGSAKLTELGVSLVGKALAPWEGRVEAALAPFSHLQAKRDAA
jgi:hypothetical protein